jgi:DNA-binding transcriptional LysR family regulator
VEDLRAGRLVELLPAWRSPDLPLTALYPYHRQMSPRIRVFVDWLAEIYSAHFASEVSGFEQPPS